MAEKKSAKRFSSVIWLKARKRRKMGKWPLVCLLAGDEFAKESNIYFKFKPFLLNLYKFLISSSHNI